MEKIWTRCLVLKTNIILDFGFWSRAERAQARSLVEHLGAPRDRQGIQLKRRS